MITGASSGIGNQLARQLGQQKARLVVNARRQLPLEELASQLSEQGVEVHQVVGDITEPEIQAKLVATATEVMGGLDCLINNAGVGAMGAFSAADPERLRKMMEVNFFAATELTRLALPLLRQNPPSLVVNIGSVLGHFGTPFKSEYCASKFALHGFSEALRSEMKRERVDVLLVAPITPDSEFFERVLEDTTSKDWKKFGSMTPEKVAAKIVLAMQRGRQEIVLSTGGKSLVLIKRFLPGIFRRMITLSR